MVKEAFLKFQRNSIFLSHETKPKIEFVILKEINEILSCQIDDTFACMIRATRAVWSFASNDKTRELRESHRQSSRQFGKRVRLIFRFQPLIINFRWMFKPDFDSKRTEITTFVSRRSEYRTPLAEMCDQDHDAMVSASVSREPSSIIRQDPALTNNNSAHRRASSNSFS